MTCANCNDCPFDGRKVDQHRHELHITVEGSDVDKFKQDCFFIQLKPVLIAMQKSGGGVFHHLMTTHGFIGTPANAIMKINDQARELTSRGHKVVRRKIETTLDSTIAEQALSGQYYESHIAIYIDRKNLNELQDLERVIEYSTHGLLLSRNAFKEDSEKMTYMATLRRKELMRNEYRVELASTIDTLSKRFKIAKVISEFAWFDSNLRLDDNWR